MAWIESHQAIARHPKTKRLARRLDVSLHEAIGLLHCLWWWAFDYAPDGRLGCYEPADLADGCMWQGDPAALWDALHEAGWIDPDNAIHDWEEYAGKYVEKRAKDAARKREARERRTSVPVPSLIDGRPQDVRGMSEPASVGRPQDVRGMSQVPTNQPDQPTSRAPAGAHAPAHPREPIPLATPTGEGEDAGSVSAAPGTNGFAPSGRQALRNPDGSLKGLDPRLVELFDTYCGHKPNLTEQYGLLEVQNLSPPVDEDELVPALQAAWDRQDAKGGVANLARYARGVILKARSEDP